MIFKVGSVVAALVFAANLLEKLAGTLGLVAGIIISVGIIFAGSRAFWRFVRRLEDVVENTGELPQFMRDQAATNRQVQERLDAGADRMASIEGALRGWADADRAAVSTAIEIATKPRSARRTDPPSEVQ